MHTQDITRFQHAHVFHYTGAAAEKGTLRVILLTLFMMVAEIVAGWIFNSMALLADGWHMSTHAAALGISWLAFVLARRLAADRRFTFGTWKIEVLGGFASGILLGVVGLFMAGLSVERLLHPEAIQYDQAIIVAVIGLGVNLASLRLLGFHAHGMSGPVRPHAHAHDADRDELRENLNLRAAYLHVAADAATSVLAIAALLGGKYLHWNWLDPVMGLVGAALILRWTRSLLGETGAILLDREASSGVAAEIRRAVESDADARISDLHVWNVGQDKQACIVALVAANPLPANVYKERLRPIASLVHVTVETARCPAPPS